MSIGSRGTGMLQQSEKVDVGFGSVVGKVKGGLVWGVGWREEEIYSGRGYTAQCRVFPDSKAKALT